MEFGISPSWILQFTADIEVSSFFRYISAPWLKIGIRSDNNFTVCFSLIVHELTHARCDRCRTTGRDSFSRSRLFHLSGCYRKHMRREMRRHVLRRSSIFRTSLQECVTSPVALPLSQLPSHTVNPGVAFNALPVYNFRERTNRDPVG